MQSSSIARSRRPPLVRRNAAYSLDEEGDADAESRIIDFESLVDQRDPELVSPMFSCEAVN